MENANKTPRAADGPLPDKTDDWGWGLEAEVPPEMKNAEKTVKFHEVEIREYGVILGDHPSTTSGPPVTIEWDHQTRQRFDLNEYEEFFLQQKRRDLDQLRMPPHIRTEMLQNHHTSQEISEVQDEVRRYQQRAVIPPETDPMLEVAWESAVRKFKRWKKRRSSKAERDLAELWLRNQKQKKKSSGGVLVRRPSDVDVLSSCLKQQKDEASVEPESEPAGLRHVQSAPAFSTVAE